jgi:hypothetical protein
LAIKWPLGCQLGLLGYLLYGLVGSHKVPLGGSLVGLLSALQGGSLGGLFGGTTCCLFGGPFKAEYFTEFQKIAFWKSFIVLMPLGRVSPFCSPQETPPNLEMHPKSEKLPNWATPPNWETLPS